MHNNYESIESLFSSPNISPIMNTKAMIEARTSLSFAVPDVLSTNFSWQAHRIVSMRDLFVAIDLCSPINFKLIVLLRF